jgi:hypothetical protein
LCAEVDGKRNDNRNDLFVAVESDTRGRTHNFQKQSFAIYYLLLRPSDLALYRLHCIVHPNTFTLSTILSLPAPTSDYIMVSSDDMTRYGYQEATPDARRRQDLLERRVQRTSSTESFPLPVRRSSMKQGIESTQRRRASIQMGVEITVYLPGKDEPLRRRSSIKFAKTVQIKNVEKLQNLTDRPNELWFQTEEYKRMRRNSMQLVKKVERGQMGVGNRSYCIRGLERLLHRESTTRQRTEAWEAVLSQQEMQRDQGYWDEQFMADAYKYTTMESAIAAASRGKEDEAAILGYMNDSRIRNRNRRLSYF